MGTKTSMDQLCREIMDKALQELMVDQEFQLLLSVKTVAKLLNVNERMAYELLRKQVIPSLKIGKKYMCPVVSLMAWLEEQVALPHEDQATADIYLRKNH